MTIRIELDSVRRDMRGSTWRMFNRASACGFEAVGDGNIEMLLCRKLIEAGIDGECEFWRGKTPVFGAKSIRAWAEGHGLKTGPQPQHLRRESR